MTRIALALLAIAATAVLLRTTAAQLRKRRPVPVPQWSGSWQYATTGDDGDIVGMPTTIRQALGWDDSPYANSAALGWNIKEGRPN